MPRERYRFRSAQRDLNAKRKVSFSLAYIADCFVSWFRQGVWREAGLADVLARTAEPGLLQSNLRQDNRSACVIEYMLYICDLRPCKMSSSIDKPESKCTTYGVH